MGGSSSNTNCSSGPSADALLAAETRRKNARQSRRREREEKCQSEVHNRELDIKVKAIEESLKKDHSQANVIAQFAKVIEIEGLNKMDCVKEIVNSMGDGWREIMRDEERLADTLGPKTVSNLKSIRGEYFSLLLDTNVVIDGLLEQSQMQKEHVVGLLGIVNKALEGGEDMLTKGDRLVYNSRTKKLVQWIDQTELVEITGKWKLLMKRLEKQKTFIEKAARAITKTVKQVSSSFWGKFFAVLGTVTVLCGVIVAVIATAGTAAVVFGGAAAIVGGVVATIGVVKLAGHVHKQSSVMTHRISAITAMLDRYIKTCRLMQKDISDMQRTQNKLKARTGSLDEESCVLIKEGLDVIGRHLDAYMNQGKVVVSKIEKACEEFINLK